jgi:hypothetical protein
MSRRPPILVVVAVALVGLPVRAQVREPLFDTFNFKLEGSWVGVATTIRLDSEVFGRGTTLSFENDLGLPDNDIVPSLSFEWQVSRRHRLGVRWQDVKRDSTTQVLQEIEWGGEIILIDANVTLGFDIRTIATCYPWLKDRWAGGFGIGFRVMDLKTALTVDNIELEEHVDGIAPLPYINFEYRRIIGERWRVKAEFGWFEVKIGDIKGGQYIGRLAGEYITSKRWGFGAALNYSNIAVDWDDIDKGPVEDDVLKATIDLDINDISLYFRVRW